jgi:hypothetical protein
LDHLMIAGGQGKTLIGFLEDLPIGLSHSRARYAQGTGPSPVKPRLHFPGVTDFGAMKCRTEPHVIVIASCKAFIEFDSVPPPEQGKSPRREMDIGS